MYASGSSPPPHDIYASVSASNSAPETPNPNPTSSATIPSAAPAPAHSRKRKRGQVASTTLAASPAPSDPGSTNGATDLLASRADLFARQILTIARGPSFIPVSEDSEWFRTDSAAVNRLGFRYTPAGINPSGFITPCRTIESSPTSFRVSWEDRSQSLKVTKDGLGLGGSKGFRSARCNAPIREGKWYLEVKIEVGGGETVGDSAESLKGDGSHVRLGWGRREAPLNGPVGLDGYSYGYRDKTGEKVTVSRPRPYGKPFKSGDVIGMYISLPPIRKPNKKDPHDPAHIHRERIPIDLKGQEVFEILEYPVSKEMSALMENTAKPVNTASVPSSNTKKPATGAKLPDRSAAPANPSPKTPATVPLRPLPTLQDSRIAFFVNGESQGIAFQDIYDFLPLPQTDNQRKSKGRRVKEGVKEHRENPFDDGTLGYYPMISVFNDATVRINPGPDFEYPPPLDIDALLDGKIQPESKAAAGDADKSEPSSVVKSEGDSTSMDVDDEIKPITSNVLSPNRTWRPAVERYPEFMKEQWELDTLEEEEAKVEFEKQKAKEEAGISSKTARSRKTDPKKAATARATAANRKKKSTPALAHSKATSKAGTPALEEEILTKSESIARARKKSKKAEGQAALGIAVSQHQHQQHIEAPTPRSATETPAGTPPPPSISSTAAAAAAAHLHLHLHAASARADLPNRPSPSPLRQSTAYREDVDEADMNNISQRDRDALPILIGPGSHGPRPRAPPGSKEGRQRAAAAAAAAAAQVWSAIPPASSSSGHSPTIPQQHQYQQQQQGGRAGNLMSLAAIAGSSAALPTSSSSTSGSKPLSGPSNNLNHQLLAPPPPPQLLAQHRSANAASARPAGAPPTSHLRSESRSHSRGGTASVEDDFEDEFIAAARSPRSDRYPEEEEEDGASEYDLKPGPYDGEEEEEEEEGGDLASVPGDEGEDGTTDGDGDVLAYPYDRVRGSGRDVDMAGEDTDDGGGTLGDEMDGYQGSRGGRTRSQSPE